MNNPQKVHGFLKANPRQKFCDDCIERKTGVDRHEANTIGRTLALFPGEFKRTKAVCPQQCSSRDKDLTEAI
jgi:hypothetical protein